ncbi:MAG TPA: hypothetical protein VN200_02155 [Rhodoglobus sp.]|nr:hypothetical protein [Rhodoglobus sp.]
MSTSTLPDESTLGVVLGRGRRRAEATRRVIREVAPRRASLGTGFIGVGAAVVVGLRAIYGFVWFLSQWNEYPDPLPALGAWVVLAGVLLATVITARVGGEQLPDWLFALFVGGLFTALVLDLWAIWPLHDIGRNATAAVTAGMALLVVVTLRRARDILIIDGVLGLTLAGAIVLNSSLAPEDLGPQITSLAFAVLPAAIGVVVVRGFRRLVQVELDRVLVQSTVQAPRFAVGMLASEELARLDLAAEELLEAIANGRTKLPLGPKTASSAASLATELRLHLIEGRRETWLYHAITESDFLGKSVTLVDKGSLAGLLDPQQRDGLLSTVWLLVSDTTKNHPTRTVQITVGPATGSVETPNGRRIDVPIVITTTGVPRNRVDPATWEAIRRVGQYADSTQNSSLRVDVHCLVANPADH